MRPEYGPAQEDELATLAAILCRSFAAPPEVAERWYERTGVECQRVLRKPGTGRPVASLTSLLMGQYFGGRRVPMAGVAAVGCAPEHRGGGAATRLMQSHVRELGGNGVALSMLYPATVPLYRRVGYGVAGARFELKLPLRGIDVRDRALSLRPIAPDEDVAELYAAHARGRSGWLDRHAHLTGRIRRGSDGDAEGYVIQGERGPEGYLFLTRVRNDALGHYDLRLSDVVTLTAGAGRRVLGFLADHGSLGDTATWFGGPADPLLSLLSEPRAEVRRFGSWMLRMVNVPAALEARGWPLGVSASLHLEVDDDLLSSNRGRFVVDIEGGSARVRSGGDGHLSLDVRDLAPLFTGYESATALAALGRLRSSSDRAVALANAAFAGPFPACPDVF